MFISFLEGRCILFKLPNVPPETDYVVELLLK